MRDGVRQEGRRTGGSAEGEAARATEGRREATPTAVAPTPRASPVNRRAACGRGSRWSEAHFQSPSADAM